MPRRPSSAIQGTAILFGFLLLTNESQYQLDLVRRQALGLERVTGLLVFAAIGDHVGKVGIRGLLGVVRNQAGNLGGRSAREVGAVASCTFRFVEARAIV